MATNSPSTSSGGLWDSITSGIGNLATKYLSFSNSQAQQKLASQKQTYAYNLQLQNDKNQFQLDQAKINAGGSSGSSGLLQYLESNQQPGGSSPVVHTVPSGSGGGFSLKSPIVWIGLAVMGWGLTEHFKPAR